MNTKRTLIAISLTCVLSAGLIFYYFYNKYYKASSLPEYIPAEAEAVVYINAKVVYEHFFKKKDSALQLRGLRSNPYFESVKDIRETGIDMLSDAACIQYKGIYYGLFVLDDVKQFEQTVQNVRKNLLGPIKEGNGFSKVAAVKDSFILAWNKQRLVFIPKSKKQADDAYIKEILEVSSGDNFSRRGTFDLVKKEDALIWFWAGKAEPGIISPSSLKGYVTWDTTIHVFATDDVSSPYSLDPMVLGNKHLNYVYSDTGNSFVNDGLKALTLAYLPGQLEQLKGIELSHYHKTFIRRGKQEIRNEIITYAYDDNFNKQKIVTVRVDTVDVAALYLYSPDGKPKKVITNGSDTSIMSGFQSARGVKLAASFNQDFLGALYPVPLKYHIRLLHEQEAGKNYFWLEVKPGEWQQLIGL
jgi:hypothetical protein